MSALRQAPVVVAAEVAEAVANGDPVVALESTVISHGLPHPHNVELATHLEATIRRHGAVPATIAIADGAINVGLSETLLQRLGTEDGVVKVSRRNLASTLAARSLGATTVAATMIGAQLAGIEVFSTGGIGGVHRGGHESLDISADLLELARTPVAVVCAGAKSILDLARTLEVLETHGVPVIGYGTDQLPAFFTAHSPHRVPIRCDDPSSIADVLDVQWRGLGLELGALICVPVPAGAEVEMAVVDSAIEAAEAEALAAGIIGADVTPFLLKRLAELTHGATLTANLALLEHNAVIGAQIARALSARAVA
jgi:pseudouridylate synthase